MLAPYAAERGVRLALEPLHPMYCADRAVLSTLGQALDLAGAAPAPRRSASSSTPSTSGGTRRSSSRSPGRAGRIAGYQVCDFLVPLPADVLLGRGMMGDGVIDFAPLTAAVAAAGYTGDIEVEIFNAEVWAADPDEVLTRVRTRSANSSEADAAGRRRSGPRRASARSGGPPCRSGPGRACCPRWAARSRSTKGREGRVREVLRSAPRALPQDDLPATASTRIPLASSRASSSARAPIYASGSRTVDSAGTRSRSVTMSSNPATETSSGTLIPRSLKAASAPTAITSLTANTQVASDDLGRRRVTAVPVEAAVHDLRRGQAELVQRPGEPRHPVAGP